MTLKQAGFLLLFVLGLVLVGWVAWAIVIRPGQNASDAVQAKGDVIVAAGEANKAADAIPIIEKHFTEKERIERVTIQGNVAILAAPGAAELIPADVDRVARAALCLHEVYRGDPACQFVPDIDPRSDASANPWGAAAVG